MFNQPVDPASIWKSTEGLPEEQRKFAFERLLTPNRDSSDIDALLGIYEKSMDQGRMREQLKLKSEFDKEQMAAAAPYHYLSQMPGQIAQGFGNAAAMNILGARSAVDAMNQTLQAYPRTAFTSAPFQAQKYFS
jgi:hypothetical protein